MLESEGAFAMVSEDIAIRCKELHREFKRDENIADCILTFTDIAKGEEKAHVISLLESSISKRCECMRLCPGTNDNGHRFWVSNLEKVLSMVKRDENSGGLFGYRTIQRHKFAQSRLQQRHRDERYRKERRHEQMDYPGVTHIRNFKRSV